MIELLNYVAPPIPNKFNSKSLLSEDVELYSEDLRVLMIYYNMNGKRKQFLTGDIDKKIERKILEIFLPGKKKVYQRGKSV